MVKNAKTVEEFKVLHWIEANFKPEFITVDDFPTLSYGKRIIDRNNDTMIVFWDIKNQTVSYSFMDETGNMISNEKKIFLEVYREYADCFNGLMDQLDEKRDTQTSEAVKKLDNLNERLRIAELNLILQQERENQQTK